MTLSLDQLKDVIEKLLNRRTNQIRAITTNIFNDYIVNLPRHALGWWVCRGLNVPIKL